MLVKVEVVCSVALFTLYVLCIREVIPLSWPLGALSSEWVHFIWIKRRELGGGLLLGIAIGWREKVATVAYCGTTKWQHDAADVAHPPSLREHEHSNGRKAWQQIINTSSPLTDTRLSLPPPETREPEVKACNMLVLLICHLAEFLPTQAVSRCRCLVQCVSMLQCPVSFCWSPSRKIGFLKKRVKGSSQFLKLRCEVSMHRQKKGYLKTPLLLFLLSLYSVSLMCFILFSPSMWHFMVTCGFISTKYMLYSSVAGTADWNCSNILVQYIASLVLQSIVFCTWAQC